MVEVAEITRIARVVREEVCRVYAPDTCVLTARCLMDVFDFMAIDSRALPVKMAVFNPPMARYFNHGFPGFEVLARRVKEPGNHSVGIGFHGGNAPGRWNGHLVVLLDQDRLMIDPSADQASRPQYDINLDIVSAAVNDKFTSGAQPMYFQQYGCTFFYDAQPEDLYYQTGRDWVHQNKRHPLVMASLARLSRS